MSRDDAPVGRSVQAAALGVREFAAEAAQVGADTAARAIEITERKMAEGAAELAKAGRVAGRDLAKGTRTSRRGIRTNSAAARDEMLARAVKMRGPGQKAAKAAATVLGTAGETGRRRRRHLAGAQKDFNAALAEAKSVARGDRASRSRWPWVLGLGAVTAGAAYLLHVKRQHPLVEEEKAPAVDVVGAVPADRPEPVVPPKPAVPVNDKSVK